jgi:hypothetical protein
MTTRRLLAATTVCGVLLITAGVVFAQRGGRGRDRDRDDDFYSDERNGVPDWKNDPAFEKDVFTFVRLVYGTGGGYSRGGFFDGGVGGGRRGGRGRGWGGRGGWATDFPDSDLNFSFRLQQLTSLKVNPQPIYLPATDPAIFDYPFVYMIEPGNLWFTDEEAQALRKYLLNGGFLMVDDFWGDYEYENFYNEIRKVFPEDKYDPKELDVDHEIFNIVYRLKDKPQMPAIGTAVEGRPWGITWEDGHGGDCRTVHYKGIFDDKGRMMVIICHNTDLGDGWEREGEDPWYFTEFAEKKAYPMGINIVVYAMTH